MKGILKTLFILFIFPVMLMAESQQTFENKRFGKIDTFGNPSASNPTVIFFTDKDGWTSNSKEALKTISANAFTIAINSGKYLSAISSDDKEQECSYLAGEIERLAQSVEKSSQRKTYQKAIVVGIGEGAALAFVVYHQHPKSFAGLLTINLSAEINAEIRPCAASAYSVRPASTKVSIEILNDQTNTSLFRQANLKDLESVFSALRSYLGSSSLTKEKEDNSHIIEIAAKGRSQNFFAVFVSGDGGWATIDRDIGDYLSNHQIPVVGIDALKFFWRKRTPEESARELERVISKYMHAWEKEKVILLGFSMGADVLPFMYNKLSADLAARVQFLGLLSPGKTTDFEVNISDWIGASMQQEAHDISAEIAKINDIPIACFYGEDEINETSCTQITQKNATIKGFVGDHHFNGEYKKISLELIKLLPH